MALTSETLETEHELRVIHALRLKAFLDTPDIAKVAGLDVPTATATLQSLGERECVKYSEGRMTGWRLLKDGRAHGERLLADELDGAAKRDELHAIYQRFLEHNQPFLGLCTDWQVRMIDGEQVINDHSDAAYDEQVIGRLAETQATMAPILADLANVFDRFAHYGPDFATALANVQAGEIEWFTKPIIESYHTVWFELHEDLLASLGIERAKEGHA